MNKFVNAIEKEMNWKETENGQTALKSTLDACLDLFGTIGALRTRDENEIVTKFAKAYGENPLVAIKTLFYARDIEQGLGERRTFKAILHYLGNAHTQDVVANLENIVKFGRYDDLYCLVGTAAEGAVAAFIKEQVKEDIILLKNGKPVSLIGKWLKSTNTSSAESCKLGKWTAQVLGLTLAQYRKILSALRKRINLVETLMVEGRWDEIDFTAVPGGAMKKYSSAFARHQEQRFNEYLRALKEGKKVVVEKDGKVIEKEAKINTKHLFPYEIIEKYCKDDDRRWSSYRDYRPTEIQPDLEAMWNGLEDYIQGVQCNTVVMADVSGSMEGRPMDTSIGLAIYFAERNTGPFHNKFMTFSDTPTFISLPENSTLKDKINVTAEADWDNSTNIEAAFDLILHVAVKNRLTQDDLPKSLVIITDTEFNKCTSDNSTLYSGWYRQSRTNMTFYDQMKAKYAAYGYELPEIVFWNVNARNDTYHADAYAPHVRMVSGQAASVFKTLIDGKTHTPYEFMLEVLFNERYNCVVLG